MKRNKKSEKINQKSDQKHVKIWKNQMKIIRLWAEIMKF